MLDDVIQRKLDAKEIIFISGLVSGVSTAVLFNPYDRALYLSVKDRRSFLHYSNWKRPFTGFGQSLLGRTISGGMYFPLFDTFKPLYKQHLSLSHESLMLSFLAGNSAGAVNGVLLNGLTAIKYQSWASNESLVRTARHMARKGGVRPFLKGINSTVIRDTVFGGSFGFLQHLLQSSLARSFKPTKEFQQNNKESFTFLASMISGAVATILSSPFNYVRNMQYATAPGHVPPSAAACLSALWAQARSHPHSFAFIQERFRIGWGTFRVAIGMAFGWDLYSRSKKFLGSEYTAESSADR